jgi:hypothetical protein
VQKANEKLLLTRPKSSGIAYWAKLKSLKIDDELFPDLSKVKPLLALHVENFKMKFPAPELI